MGKYKKQEREPEIEKILSAGNLSPDQKIVMAFRYLEKFMYDLEDSTQLAIYQIDEDLKNDAPSSVSL